METDDERDTSGGTGLKKITAVLQLERLPWDTSEFLMTTAVKDR